MMRASTSFAEGAFILLQRRSLEFKTEPILPRVLPQSDFSSFFGCSACFFYPPLLFSRRCFRGHVFQHHAIEREEERGSRFSALRDRKRERERTTRERRIRVFSFFFQLLTPLFFFPFVLERARTKNAQKKNRFRPDDDREKTRRILLPVLLLAE